jgi:TfoX/Sxy family transcriptional regulator of competence genes
MVYDPTLADRLLAAVDYLPDITTRSMFGGFAIMWRGNMMVSVMGDDLMARIGPVGIDEALAEPGVRAMDFTGRPMRGMVYVSPEVVRDDVDLERWVERARTFVESLPAK